MTLVGHEHKVRDRWGKLGNELVDLRALEDLDTHAARLAELPSQRIATESRFAFIREGIAVLADELGHAGPLRQRSPLGDGRIEKRKERIGDAIHVLEARRLLQAEKPR